MTRKTLLRFGPFAAIAVALGTIGFAPSPALARPEPDAKEAAPVLDTLIFRNGNTIHCTILEETETSVTARVTIAGISTETQYPKSDILEVKRAPKQEAKPSATPATAAAKAAAADSGLIPSSPSADSDAVVDKDGKPIPPGTLKVYVTTFPGEFGRDVSKTPVQQWMNDVAKIQPDVLIVRFDHEFFAMGAEKLDFLHVGDEGQVYSSLEKAREIDTLITDRIRDDPAFKTKPRLVAWINRALGGGAFLPFVFPEIYFTSKGHMGGIGGLDSLFKGVGDEVAQRKQQSLRLGRAKGLAEKGGHDSRILKAMTWGDFTLSYRISGGRIEWLEDKMPTEPDWVLIKDDGAMKDEHRDTGEDVVRLKGNDFLTLDSNTAEIIGLSKGTADSVDDLLFRMGVSRNYALVKNKSKAIFSAWHDEVTKAEKEFDRYWRQYADVEIRDPGGYPERTAARAKRKSILLQIESMLKKYQEAIDPRRIRGAPQSWMTEIRLMIDRIETEQRLDRP